MTGRRRTDQPGPAPSPADVPTSATLSATGGATRAGRDAGRSRAPVAPSAGRAAAAAPSPAVRAPRTTSLPFTPGPPTPSPELEQLVADEHLDRPAAASAPAAGRAAGPTAWTPAAPPPAPAPAARPGRTPAAAPDRRGPAAERETTALPPLAWDDEPGEAPLREGAPERVPGPVSGPVGGRAAARLERQAAEAAARKGGRRGSTAAGRPAHPGAPPAPPAPPAGPDREPGPGRQRGQGVPRRTVQLALATVVVALVVLGVWSFTSPRTQETSAQTPAATAAPTSSAAPSAEASPSLEATPSVPAPPAGPVRAPITVLNSTKITGLAADGGARFSAGGWQVDQTGSYGAADVAVTTVYFTEGDPVQQEAANQLMAQFPDLTGGPAPRFFDVPDAADPGLVVVVTGDWRP